MSAISPGAISVERIIDGKFPLLQELGWTEWSSAYLTELDEDRARKVAIKIFKFTSVEASATTARWEIAETVSHPHLMPLFCSGRCEFDGEDLLYVVTDYAEETLSQILPERPLSPAETRAMLDPVIDALSCLHQRGLTHGHLRPTNIMVIDDQVKLSPDFGWCSRIRNIYDPPESGTGNAAPAADVWSLGILLVEALTQRLPAWDRSKGGEPEIPATIPEPFFTICRECLRFDAEHRCTLAAIKALLGPARAAEPVAKSAEPANAVAAAIAAEAVAVEAIIERAAKPSFRSRAVILAAALLFLLLMIAAFRFGWNLTPSTPARALQPVVNVSAPAPAADAAMSGVVKGSVTHQTLPDIPANIAGAIRGHFKVSIRAEVDADGNVSEASIDSPGPSRYFADQALLAVQSWKFAPAKVDGHNVASRWLLQFQFGRAQSAVTPLEEAP